MAGTIQCGHRGRKDFGKIPSIVEIPNLIEVQKRSYENFLQKDVALVSILGPLEAFRDAQIEASANYIYTPLEAAAALYLCVTVPLALLLDRWERKRRR